LSQKNNVITYLILSLIGILILVVAILLSYPSDDTIGLFDRMIIGGAFITSCILGLSLALKPNWIRSLKKQGNVKKARFSKITKQRRGHHGHHPDCSGFSSHVIKTKNKTYCAGCMGLAAGSILSMILIILYIIIPMDVNRMIFFLMLLFGLFFIIMNFIKVLIRGKNSILNLSSNVLLVVGFFFVVIGVFQLTGKITYGILAVILSFLWLDTRIQLSSWNHRRICNDCNDSCKVYSA
jgi:hypothetical protein